MQTKRIKKAKFTRAVDCIINILFNDSNNPDDERRGYCYKNCQFKCRHGKAYKTIQACITEARQMAKSKEDFEKNSFYILNNFLLEQGYGKNSQECEVKQ